MESTFSLISNFDNLFSTDTCRRNKEYTYADQYPVFIDKEKFSSIITKSTSVTSNSNNSFVLLKSRSPDTEKSRLPSISESFSHESKNSGFHFSKFPLSSLNVELEKQCVLAEIYQNIDKIKVKEKIFPPIKVVWNKSKAKPKKNTIKASLIKMKPTIHGDANNVPCNECGNFKCKCEVIDEFCKETWNNLKGKMGWRQNIFETTNKSKHIRKISDRGLWSGFRSDYNHLAEKLEQKKTRRRKVFSSDYQDLHKEVLSISPKRVYYRVLDEDF